MGSLDIIPPMSSLFYTDILLSIWPRLIDSIWLELASSLIKSTNPTHLQPGIVEHDQSRQSRSITSPYPTAQPTIPSPTYPPPTKSPLISPPLYFDWPPRHLSPVGGRSVTSIMSPQTETVGDVNGSPRNRPARGMAGLGWVVFN
eukprot:scaffold93406_cov33-Prasinocladus_malaysianus.AAC.2